MHSTTILLQTQPDTSLDNRKKPCLSYAHTTVSACRNTVIWYISVSDNQQVTFENLFFPLVQSSSSNNQTGNLPLIHRFTNNTVTKHDYKDDVFETAGRRTQRDTPGNILGKCKVNFHQSICWQIGNSIFYWEVGRRDPLRGEQALETDFPAGGVSGKAIMILNVTPPAIRANAGPLWTACVPFQKTTCWKTPDAANSHYKYRQTPAQHVDLLENTFTAQVRYTMDSKRISNCGVKNN